MSYLSKQGKTLKTVAAAVAGAVLLYAPAASALGLVEAYQAALKNDAAYRAAYYASEAGKENRLLGRSNLLPSISGSYNASKNRTTISEGSASVARDYISRNATIQVRQTLFSLDAYARYKQGAAQSNYAAAQFESQQQEVISRVVNAYFDVLYKQDLLALFKVERDVYVEQRKVNDRLFEKGEGTRTDMLESQARLDAAEATVLEGQDALNNSRSALAAVIGGDVGELDRLVSNFETRPADTQGYEAWKTVALERNPDIKTLVYGVEIAKQEVNKAYSGHTPRVDFVASYGRSSADTVQTFNQDNIVRSIGVQVNIPLYSGGAVSAQSRQAVANQEKAKADLQGQKDKVLLELRKDYDSLASSVARIDALKKAVASSELLIKATQQSVKGGVRINLDVLNATQQLFTNKRDLAQARYNYLLNTLRMRAAAGTLSETDVQEIAPYFRAES
ncbi:TolC family outer membrane protein [Rugamonas aquatica]|uniref:TolC family outer membrane protein n=1 Tax=Rugamonas aquatica TaxID=2743357 RepID=A0A6A7N4A2_9BURK|nr:TolC family outer membrane protein [Rugamonas aquatica]MQA39883.1 TolC family outer membrane protein [Rugamonas aquatica]